MQVCNVFQAQVYLSNQMSLTTGVLKRSCTQRALLLSLSTLAVTLLVQERLISTGLQVNKNLSPSYKLRTNKSIENACVPVRPKLLGLWVHLFRLYLFLHAFTSVHFFKPTLCLILTLALIEV